MKFKQSQRLQPYINFNTNKNIGIDLAKDFYMLMNNSVYGKTTKVKSLRHKIDIKLVTNSKDYQKLVSKPNFFPGNIFNKNMSEVLKIKEVLTLNIRGYFGLCLIDLNYSVTYYYQYKHLKKQFFHRAQLMFTDTDNI